MDHLFSRRELLKWLSQILKKQVLRIDELANGQYFCQLLAIITKGKAPIQKLNLQAKLQHQRLLNLKIFKNQMVKAKMEKDFDIMKIAKKNYPAILDLLQWFRKELMTEEEKLLLKPEGQQKKQDNQITSNQQKHSTFVQNENSTIKCVFYPRSQISHSNKMNKIEKIEKINIPCDSQDIINKIKTPRQFLSLQNANINEKVTCSQQNNSKKKKIQPKKQKQALPQFSENDKINGSNILLKNQLLSKSEKGNQKVDQVAYTNNQSKIGFETKKHQKVVNPEVQNQIEKIKKNLFVKSQKSQSRAENKDLNIKSHKMLSSQCSQVTSLLLQSSINCTEMTKSNGKYQ